MGPFNLNIGLFLFLTVLVFGSYSHVIEESNVTENPSDSDRCVCNCRPQVTINRPVCRSATPMVAGTSYNCTANQEMVSSELREMTHQLEQLQTVVSAIAGILNNADVILPKDCSQVLARGVMSGVYTVKPLDSSRSFQVYCDMDTDGGGWTVFQRRQDGTVDFYRNFANYSRGFGDIYGEFWLGNDNLHRLTAHGNHELRVDLSDFDGSTAYAVYDDFSVADVSDYYTLTVGTYSGTAGDSLSYHNNMQFSTKDRDNDQSLYNCAGLYHGAWWYCRCHHSNLNGEYLGDELEQLRGVRWYHWKEDNSLKTTEMKFRIQN